MAMDMKLTIDVRINSYGLTKESVQLGFPHINYVSFSAIVPSVSRTHES